MEILLQKSIEKIERIKEKYNSSDTKQKIWLRLALLIFNPCLYVLKSKLNSAVRLILTILTAFIMLGVTTVIIPFYFLWYIWTNTNLKKSVKITISVIIVFALLLGYISIRQKIRTVTFSPQTNASDTNSDVLSSSTQSQDTTNTDKNADTITEEKETEGEITTTETTTAQFHSIIAEEAEFVQVFDTMVFISKGEHKCIIGAKKDTVNKLLGHFDRTENYYIPTNEYSAYTTKYTNDNLMICVDYTKDYIAKGVYIEAFDVSDPLTGEGSYVYEHYDEIINLVTGGQDIKIEKDTEYANLTGIKKYPMALCIGELYE